MASPTKDTFDAVAQAMRGVVQEYPLGVALPSWVTGFLLAVGGPSQLAEMGHQALKDAQDAEMWRFLLQSISEDSVETKIMEEIAHGFELDGDDPVRARAAFAAHVAEGLRRFKALS